MDTRNNLTPPITRSPLKNWIKEFLFVRGPFQQIESKPLYRYHVTLNEFQELETLLSENAPEMRDGSFDKYWSAAFCLYVSEWFRREYDKKWSWNKPKSRIKRTFTPLQEKELVKKGLDFWRRPIIDRNNRQTYLGSLFAEGGLPWLLVQSDTHGFGRAVRKGIKNFYRTKTGLRTTADLINDYIDALPQTFQNPKTCQILAGIVEQLMALVEQYPLEGQSDPATYLDNKAPKWREAFPIPLDEENARTLLNDWLQDAEKQKIERKQIEEEITAFACESKLVGQIPEWQLESELVIPKKTEIPFFTQLSTTRLELGFFEGDSLTARGGAVYVQVEDKTMSIRFPKQTVKLHRKFPERTISLRLLENGHPIHTFYFEGSSLEMKDAPLFFEDREGEWWLVAQASCKVASGFARVRVPSDATITSGTWTFVAEESCGAKWVDTHHDLRIHKPPKLFTLGLNSTSEDHLKLSLKGVPCLYNTRESVVFMGFPEIKIPEDSSYEKEEITEFINREKASTSLKRNLVGRLRIHANNANGETILHRSVGVLPEGFSVSLFPALRDKPARIQLRNAHNLLIQVVGNSLEPSQLEQGTIYLNHQGNEPPSTFHLEVSSAKNIEPVVLILPYPYQGVRLINSSGIPESRRSFLLNELIGMELALFSGQTQGQTFHIHLELMYPSQVNDALKKLSRYFRIDVAQKPQLLSLFSFHDSIMQLLGAVDDQDAYVRFILESSQRLMTLEIRRYIGEADKIRNTSFSLKHISSQLYQANLAVEAMLLSDPSQKPILLKESTTEGVGTGVFTISPAMKNRGPWLIYAPESTALKFRPLIHMPLNTFNENFEHNKPRSLHQATQLYHPVKNPHVIDKQIDIMTHGFDHSGWLYLAELKANHSHMPLSVFQAWQSLASNTKALAMAVFRLEIDETFCNRIRDELAVTWEEVTLTQWHRTYRDFSEWLKSNDYPPPLIDKLLQERKKILESTVSGFKDLKDFIISGKATKLKLAFVEKNLLDWYQTLRRQHHQNQSWPENLGTQLTKWINKTNLPVSIQNLSRGNFDQAVTYLPIFMAYVTAGKATLAELDTDRTYLTYSTRLVSDFDRYNWFTPVHTMMVVYLMSQSA